MTSEVEVCPDCRKPIEADQPVHGTLGIHWDCYELRQKRFRMSQNRAERALRDIDRIVNSIKE